MRHGFPLAGISLLWLVGLKRDWDCPVPYCIMDSCDQWGFQLFFRPQWQSLCTALTAGNCLPLGLCKGTVKESNHWHIFQPITTRAMFFSASCHQRNVFASSGWCQQMLWIHTAMLCHYPHNTCIARLIHSHNLVAVGLSVEYETWLPIDWLIFI